MDSLTAYIAKCAIAVEIAKPDDKEQVFEAIFTNLRNLINREIEYNTEETAKFELYLAEEKEWEQPEQEEP